MRVLHIVTSMTLGGIETMLVNIVNAQSLYSEVFVIIVNDLYDKNLVQMFLPRVKIFYLKRPAGSKFPGHLIRLNREIFRIHPDVIHLHNTKLWRYLFHPLIRQPIFVTVHDVYNEQTRFLYVNKFKYVFSISESVRQSLLEHAKKESVVIENGISVDSFKKKIIPCTRICRLVQVSRLEASRKGQILLLKALDLFSRQHPNYKFTLDFIGEGSSRESILGVASSLNWNGSIHFLGAKSQSFLFEHLCSYDLVVQPSYFEGFGLTIAEAMAAKVPVLIADNEGPMQIIGNGKYGLFFKRGNIDDCAKQLGKIFLNGYSWDMVEAAYHRVLERYSVLKTAKSYFDQYLKVVKNG